MAGSTETRRVTRRQFVMTLGAVGVSAAAGNLLWSFGKATSQVAGGLQRVERTGRALGVTTSIVALHEDRAIAQRALDAAFGELSTVEAVMSLYRRDSELCRLNREAVLHDPHPYMVEVLRKARAISAASGGDFDVTVQPLWALYASATRSGHLPEADEIERTRQLVDWRRVEMTEGRIHLKGSGTAVTLNGIAQGFAADCAIAALAAGGVQHALVNTGEIGALGRRGDGRRWTIGIQHPRHEDSVIARVHLDGRCVATSGDYGTTFSADHVHNHIFDPSTGRSPKEFQSVTVLAKSGLEADALSTAVFVTGLDRGIKLIESLPGADALFVLQNGDTVFTNGFPGGDAKS
jgi:thiamine biosynthesis lipoprotein